MENVNVYHMKYLHDTQVCVSDKVSLNELV